MRFKINNTALPMVRHPIVLGLILDPKLTYSTHIHNMSVHAHKPLQIINALTATGWGKQMETLMATYKEEADLEHASPILCCCCLPTPMTLASGGDSDLPTCGPPTSFSVHLASIAVTPAGSVHKSRGDNVVRMWVQLKKLCVLCMCVLQM